MSYTKVPAGHSEFGGGDGLIDPERRKDRVLSGDEELMEIYAVDPADPEADPATAPLDVVPRPTRVWPDPATAKGTVVP